MPSNAPDCRELNAEEKTKISAEFHALPHLARDFFPCELETFGPLKGVTFYCARCNEPLSSERVRLQHNALSTCDEIRALGFCAECRCMTPFTFRFRENRVIDKLLGYEWKRYQMRTRRPLWKRVLMPFGG